MKAEKDPKTGKWLIQYRYTDWQGKRRKSTKRGFATKREAEEWLRNFLMTKSLDFNMKFKDFVELYYKDMGTRLREHTMRTKRYIIDLKITPYFGEKSINEIKATDIRQWQNELISKGYSPTYLKTINNQLCAIFNYAVRYYDLTSNPCSKAGSIGKSKADEMNFWTKQEFMKFIDELMDKRTSYLAFMILYWTGMRIGELLALTPGDIDLEKHTISITKSYQRLSGKDVITEPKTPKSKRVIHIPEFLIADIQDYISSIYGIEDTDRLLPITKYFLEHEMQRGLKASGVKRIRIHDLRHSHASLLVTPSMSLPNHIDVTTSLHKKDYPITQRSQGSNVDVMTNTYIKEINKDYVPILSYQELKEDFKNQIEYDVIVTDHPYEKESLDGIVELAVEVLVVINGLICP